jgi:hypothetical protein
MTTRTLNEFINLYARGYFENGVAAAAAAVAARNKCNFLDEKRQQMISHNVTPKNPKQR